MAKELLDYRARHYQEAARELGTSVALLNRARSHGLIKVVYISTRPTIPAAEFERIRRQGLPLVPTKYRRITRGPTKVGRPRKAAKPVPPKSRKPTAAERRV